MFEPMDLLRYANRSFIMKDATAEEYVTFIEDQITHPFSASDTTNYYKKLCNCNVSKDELDEISQRFLTQLQDVYPGLHFDLSEYDQRMDVFFSPVYKFFVKNAAKMMYIFIREFIFNNKNRHVLVDAYNTSKIASYPKEQYGKKEFYILIIKLQRIIDDIFEDGVKLKEFIKYVEKGCESPVFLRQVVDYLHEGYITDDGVVKDMYRAFKESSDFRSQMNKLEMDITSSLIMPYLEENGLMDVRLPPVEELPDDLDDDEEDEDET